MRILIAPDKFKDTLDAVDVADAMARGARRVHPDASFVFRPLADGGDGTLDALLTSTGGRIVTVDVHDPIGRPTAAPLGLLDDGRAAIEMARASGLRLLAPHERDPLGATSLGTGELVAAAAERGASEVIVGIGGSASSDGGTGAATAAGWRFVDAAGRDLPPGGGELHRLHRIDGSGVSDAFTPLRVVGAADVVAPLTGDSGAARVFAPQKGASPPQVAVLERGLGVLATRLRADLGIDVEGLRGAGAGGGLGAGLVAFFDGVLGGGFDIVADAVGLDPALRECDLVITGEGRIDDGSLQGKVPVAVARRARGQKVRCVAVAGELAIDPGELGRAGISLAGSLIETVGRRRAFDDPRSAISDTVEKVLKRAAGPVLPRRVGV